MALSAKQGFFHFLHNLFAKRAHVAQANDDPKPGEHLEPKYWQEVIDFINSLNKLIQENTIEDSHIQHINQRIVDYIIYQINLKGSIEDVEERYHALDTVADRILTNSFSKLVGLKHVETTHADFTQLVVDFKKRLHERKKNELSNPKPH